MKKSPIYFISGGTGVGTSSVGLEIAKYLNIPQIISTDLVREILRNSIHHSLNPNLHKSTYNAGQTKNYESKTEAVKKSEIIRAYKNQCSAVSVGIEAIVNRALTENLKLIVEGIHLIPGKFISEEILNYDNVHWLHRSIESEFKHKRRFESRQKESPERKMAKYLNNFKEIRWLNDYLLKKAQKENYTIIDNSKSLEETKKKVIYWLNQ